MKNFLFLYCLGGIRAIKVLQCNSGAQGRDDVFSDIKVNSKIDN